MAEQHHFVAGEGALWVQPDGPNTAPQYLGCHLLGDVDEPRGDTELIYCPDPIGPSRYKVVNSIQGAAGAPTTTVTTDVTDDFDALETLECPFPLYVNMLTSGRKDIFGNRIRSFIFLNARITNRGLSNLVARSPDDEARSEQTFDISGEAILRTATFTSARQTTSEAQDLTDITFCNSEACRTSTKAAKAICQTGYCVAKAAGGASANVIETLNGGTWAATSADPFGNDEDIAAIECFEQGSDTIRLVVVRGTTDGANPIEIAYSDDGGDTWTAVDVGANNGEYATNHNALFALDSAHIWLVTSEGYIYFSGDAGLTWTTQESAGIYSGALNAVDFADTENGWVGGNGNTLARTIDGGDSWSVISGPSAEAGANVLAIDCLDRNYVWVGYDDGTLWYTPNAGTDWYQRSFTGTGAGAVQAIEFMNDLIGMLIHTAAGGAGTVFTSIDGGYDWDDAGMPTNSGIFAGVWCNERQFFVCGDAHSATGFIAKGVAG